MTNLSFFPVYRKGLFIRNGAIATGPNGKSHEQENDIGQQNPFDKGPQSPTSSELRLTES